MLSSQQTKEDSSLSLLLTRIRRCSRYIQYPRHLNQSAGDAEMGGFADGTMHYVSAQRPPALLAMMLSRSEWF